MEHTLPALCSDAAAHGSTRQRTAAHGSTQRLSFFPGVVCQVNWAERPDSDICRAGHRARVLRRMLRTLRSLRALRAFRVLRSVRVLRALRRGVAPCARAGLDAAARAGGPGDPKSARGVRDERTVLQCAEEMIAEEMSPIQSSPAAGGA
jgi:hypothetical protein